MGPREALSSPPLGGFREKSRDVADGRVAGKEEVRKKYRATVVSIVASVALFLSVFSLVGYTFSYAGPGILQTRTLEWVAISFSNA